MLVNSRVCCVVVPIYKNLFSFEEIKSVHIVLSSLPQYAIRFVVRQDLVHDPQLLLWCSESSHPDASIIAIPSKSLSSIEAYNKLMLSPWFYKLFLDWKYILIHQLDARIVNPSQLSSLLSLDYSYAGAPFVLPSRLCSFRYRFYGGNGGLSLRKVSHILQLLNRSDFYLKPVRGFRDCFSYLQMRRTTDPNRTRFPWENPLMFFQALRMARGHKNTLSTMDKTGTCQEDYIYSVFADANYSWFRVAPANVASRYFIDSFPHAFANKVNYTMLLGCHGWEKHGQVFWKRTLPAIFS
jgi:hypothetical protein